MGEGELFGVILREGFVFVYDRSTIFTKMNRNCIAIGGMRCGAGENNALSSNLNFVNEMLIFKGFDDSIEGGKVHLIFTFSDEGCFELRKSDLRVASKKFTENLARASNASV